MTTKNRLSNRILSIFLCLAMLVSYLPGVGLFANAADTGLNMLADPSTMHDWQNFFPISGNLTTENAGGVWTDKSVFADDQAFADMGITAGANRFLVALSAIGSNMTVTGSASVPTDTMLVLDMSNSMSGDGRDLVDAANETIQALLEMNPKNRVGVVLYSGSSSSSNNNNAAVLLLPLGTYEIGRWGTAGRYLNYSNGSVSLNRYVYIAGTTNRPSTYGSSKSISGATYIQKGVIAAMEEFESVSVDTSEARMPIMVLMSDGAPTLGSTDFKEPGQFNLGNGADTSAALGFVSQLSAAYAKYVIEEKYGTECLFYTLGLGVSNNSVATSVLDPKNTSDAIDTFWKSYNAAAVGDTILVANGESIIKIKEPLVQHYVDQYFSATSGDSTGGLKDAFAAIVGAIQLQSKYYPTLISDNEDLSGYVSFVDRIGTYMKVTDIKGILIHDQLFSGADLASNFVEGGGNLGTTQSPTALGDEMVWAVMARLGLATADEARALINLAYQYGQLSYTSSTEFSNYIGWYADADGKYLGFWHEGSTVIPEGSYYIMKSYGYLGEVDAAHGVAKSDMMYATVQVRERISDGEQTVSFAIPAALLPVVTYSVKLDEAGELIDLEASGAKHPIRLVYELGLDENINPFTVQDLVSAEYRNANTDASGAISFYTNQFEMDGTTGYDKVNTYAYFMPSRQNDRFYYTSDSALYSDTNGTLYTGSAEPKDAGMTLYRQYVKYEKNGTLAKVIAYHAVTADVLPDAVYDELTSTWQIPAGHVRQDYARYETPKAENVTGTLPYIAQPYVDTNTPHISDDGHYYIVGATVGNNGKLSVQPQTGLKISKELAAGAQMSSRSFTFQISNTSNPADNSSYAAYFVPASGQAYETLVKFTDGQASVALEPGDVIYIGDMLAGDVFQVLEQESADYVVQSVNGSTAAAGASITVVPNTFGSAAFVNADRGKGNLTIAKEVEHNLGTAYQIPADKSFTMHISLSGVGTANATFTASQTNRAITSITTDANGCFTVTLKHNESIELFDLPEGTVAVVVEKDPAAGFTPAYWDNGLEGDGVVTVEAERTVSVIVVNDYVPTKADPVNITVSGSKTLTGREWMEGDTFSFVLQRENEQGGWETLQTVSVAQEGETFHFGDAMALQDLYKAGSYNYRVWELAENPLAGVQYDRSVHSFTVHVSDTDMNGQLEISDVTTSRESTVVITFENGVWNVDTSFTNHYAADESNLVSVEIQKQVNNPSGSPLAILKDFQFVLTGIAGTNTEGVELRSALTNEGGRVRLNLPAYSQTGTYSYILKEVDPQLGAAWTTDSKAVTVTVEVTDNGSGVLTAVIRQENPAANDTADMIHVSFTNGYAPTAAELKIDFVRKLLSGRDMAEGEFTFEVVRTLDGATVLTGTNAAALAGQQAVVTFDGSLKFNGVGTYSYNIVETSENGNGVTADKNTYRITVTVTDNMGVLSAVYALVNAEGNTVVFRNSYVPGAVQHTIGGTKVLDGKVLVGNQFTFVLTETDGSGNAMGTILETENLANGSFIFPAITYTKAGTYYYTVHEKAVSGNADGIVYDPTVFEIVVVVADNGKGALVVQSTTVNGQENGLVKFVNRYVPAEAAVRIPGIKVLEGKQLQADSFAFELYASDNSWSQGDLLDTVRNGADGSFSFAAMDYSQAGTYYYLVKEAKGNISGIVYDENIFRVQVTVTDNQRGQLIASILVFDKNGIPQEDIRFVNRYQITGSGSVTLNGHKILENRDLAAAMFQFQLYKTDATFNTAGLQALQSAANAANGSFKFQLTYGPEDVGNTYYYVAVEENAGQTVNGVVYSSLVYHITVEVADDGLGGIRTTTSITCGGAAVTDMEFVNTYQVTGTTSVTLDGSKELTGKELVDGSFSFELYETDSSFAVSGQPYKTAANIGGLFSFDLIYDAGDIGKSFHYVVKETNGGQTIDGITYSKAQYHVTVVVADNNMGGVTAAAIITLDGAAVSQMAFVNSYMTQGTSVVFDGQKELIGREMAEGEFSFDIFTADSSFKTQGAAAQNVKNLSDGAFRFAEIALNEAKTYYFVVRENSEQPLGGVEYDAAEYRITLVVADNGKGQLEIRSTEMIRVENGNADAAEGLYFENRYTANSAEVSIDGSKILNGRPMAEGEFLFLLQEADESFAAVAGGAILEARNGADGYFAFAQLVFDEAGTYCFLVSEREVDSERVTFDKTVYRITIRVSDDGKGQLVAAEPVITKLNGEAAEEILFENTFTPKPQDLSLNITVNKLVQNIGAEAIGPQDFEFLLEGPEGNATVKTDAQGLAVFGLTFTEEDVGQQFTYKLSEINTGMEYVTYSDAEYTIVISISLSQDNRLVAKIVCNGAEVENAVAEFVNVYDYTSGPADTGDADLNMWIAALFISGGAMALIVALGAKKKEQE